MQPINLQSKMPTSPHPVLNLGFRLFFLLAGCLAILTMLKWSHITFATHFAFVAEQDMIPFFWHGHEMVYGYSLAVIAGFLLTAVKTWTNQPMPYGYKLLMIAVPWLIARVIFLLNGIHLNAFTMMAGGCDIVFWLMVTFFVTQAVWRARQKRQIGIIAKLILLLIGQIWFYWAVFSQHQNAIRMSLLFGFYLIIGVVLTIGRRVMPMFIERGVVQGKINKDGSVNQPVKNSVLLDRLSLASFFVFFLTDVFASGCPADKYILSVSALLIAISNLLRLKNWYLKSIWQFPLVWSLWLAFLLMSIGFLLFTLLPIVEGKVALTHSIAMHAVALAGVGMITLAMMTRVSLGHTGRNIHQPPKVLPIIFGTMVVAWVARVVLPLVLPSQYLLTVGISQGFWLVAFVLFCITYHRILTSPRPDGLFG